MQSVIQTDSSICYICGKYIGGKVDPHHVFGGTANRQKADEDGMVVYVHRTCHTWIHNHSISYLNQRAHCQAIWEQIYGDREDFIKRYGKSYIDELEEWRKKHGKTYTDK